MKQEIDLLTFYPQSKRPIEELTLFKKAIEQKQENSIKIILMGIGFRDMGVIVITLGSGQKLLNLLQIFIIFQTILKS